MDEYRERKARRVEVWNRMHPPGIKMVSRPCTACNGSGHYDTNGAPPCGACNGTGREKVPVVVKP